MSFIETCPGRQDIAWAFAEISAVVNDLLEVPHHQFYVMMQHEGYIHQLITDLIKRYPNAIFLPRDDAGFIDITSLQVSLFCARQDPELGKTTVAIVKSYHPTARTIEGSYLDSFGNYGHFCWMGWNEPTEDEYIKWCYLGQKICPN
jgi:hypothetical protein